MEKRVTAKRRMWDEKKNHQRRSQSTAGFRFVFEKGHLKLTLWQSFLTLLAWIAVIVPFVWVAFPVFFPQTAAQIRFRTYVEEATIFRLLALFLGISFVLFSYSFVLLTVRNNRRFRHTLRKEVLHDERKLEQRKRSVGRIF